MNFGVPKRGQGAASTVGCMKWIVGLVVVAAALSLGVFLGDQIADPTSSAEYKHQASLVEQKNKALDDSVQALEQASVDMETIQGDLPDREAAVDTAEGDLASREKKLRDSRKDLLAIVAQLEKRERAVGIIEDQIARNTVPGEGVYKVGEDMAAGTYKTAGRSGCYYAVLNSTDSFDIAVNGNPNGPAFATVGVGQYFETARCAAWVKQN